MTSSSRSLRSVAGRLLVRATKGATTVPDFVGLTWRDAGVVAVRDRVSRGMEAGQQLPRIVGDLVVIAQSIEAGTFVANGTVVELRLAADEVEAATAEA